MPSMHYAGIGSRKTPGHIQDLMVAVATRLWRLGYTLRSGGAVGADYAFELGAPSCTIFREDYADIRDPAGFRRVVYSPETIAFMESFVVAYHPVPHALKGDPRKWMRRNTLQVMSHSQEGLELPQVDFVLCWTPDGSLDGAHRSAGGTGQALRIAHRHGIPVLNLEPDANETLKRLAGILRALGVTPR